MAPRTNFQLARIFGIRIGVGASWFVVLFLFVIAFTPGFHKVLGGTQTTAYLVAVAVILSFFVSVILHELGHALVARRNGLSVAGIDLWAFGGLTRMREMASTPGVQFRVAIAGPLVTLAVIIACALAAGLAAPGGHFTEVVSGSGEVRATPVLVWLSWVAVVNAFVLVFNLIPAFPLDGGQIAQALIWWRTGDRNRATRWTGRAGQGFALALGALGLAGLANGDSFGLFTMLLAFILYQAANGAVAQGTFGQRIAGVTVADIMDREPVTIPAELSLLDAQEQFFLRYRWPWFAVVDPARHFLGVVREQRVDEEIAAGRPALPVVDVLEENLSVRIAEDQPVESLLRSEGLGRLGAMVAVDEQGVLRGVVTVAQLRKALRPAAMG
ncbi:MAG TPA: site-2 protease family protein [Solirubrobacteraceae bacterium]|jgi:Zn-dependent protease|nr:site-2 protease family protein [Solirubrobacteraceae bacterium]